MINIKQIKKLSVGDEVQIKDLAIKGNSKKTFFIKENFVFQNEQNHIFKVLFSLVDEYENDSYLVCDIDNENNLEVKFCIMPDDFEIGDRSHMLSCTQQWIFQAPENIDDINEYLLEFSREIEIPINDIYKIYSMVNEVHGVVCSSNNIDYDAFCDITIADYESDFSRHNPNYAFLIEFYSEVSELEDDFAYQQTEFCPLLKGDGRKENIWFLEGCHVDISNMDIVKKEIL